MIRALLITTALAAALLVGAVPSQAADECKGLQVCIPVKGPWVAIPAPGGLATTTSWQLTCPKGIVGGVDALASERAVAVEFPGRLGSPVNPGITTTKSLVFHGTYAGTAAPGHELPAVHRLHPDARAAGRARAPRSSRRRRSSRVSRSRCA